MEEQFEALQTAYEYIGNLDRGIKGLVEDFQEGREEKGCEVLPLIAEGLDWLIKVIKLTSEFHKGGVSYENINEKLNEVVEALENEDYILISDLFNYEILPVLFNIRKEIQTIIQ